MFVGLCIKKATSMDFDVAFLMLWAIVLNTQFILCHVNRVAFERASTVKGLH